MGFGHDANLSRLNSALEGVNLSAPSVTKFARLEEAISAVLDIPLPEVMAATISKPGNFTVRVNQSERAQGAELFACVIPHAADVEATQRAVKNFMRENGRPSKVLFLASDGDRFDVPWAASLSGPGEGRVVEFFDRLGTPVEVISSHLTDTGPQVANGKTSLPALIPIELDSRVRRMLRTAVASRRAIMLVGPPGTGKTQLITELLAEVAEDPAAFGMTKGHEKLEVTPDESWSTRELVGGETVDDEGRIRFAPGHLLEAIAQDRWLVLDEANRADMDRIFGGMLTWLSDETVVVGRVTNDPNSENVTLGWTDDVDSSVDGLDALRGNEMEPVAFRAGTEWRLLGTFNAMDAQRVFQFGLALSRRFAQIPVPPPTPEAFGDIIEGRLRSLPEGYRQEVRDRITKLYAAHAETEHMALGPALFLEIPGYLAAGEGSIDELLAEAYLTSVGSLLARFDEDSLDQLGAALEMHDVLGVQWAWVRSQLDALR